MATNWDATKPAGTTKIRLSDEQLRSNFAAIETALGQEHEFPVTEATDGLHKQVTFSKQIADPTPGANTGAVYISDIAASAELMWQDENGNSCQVTTGGVINGAIPSGTVMFFYQDTAPTGWTIDATVNDKLIFVSKGSGAGGETGGGAHSTGTWTSPDHTLTEAEMPAHSHKTYNGSVLNSNVTNGGIAGCTARVAYYQNSADTGGDGAHNHGDTWRPASYVVIIATKD